MRDRQQPIRPDRSEAPGPQEQDVLAESAAGLEQAARPVQVALDQPGQRRPPCDLDQLLHTVVAPVLGPELLRGGPGVVGERNRSGPLTERGR